MSAQPNNITDLNQTDGNDDDNQQEETVPQIVDTPKKRKHCRALLNDVRNLQEQRKLVNEEITEKLSELQLEGIPRQAAKEALKRWQLSDEQRRARDGAYAFCLKALDIGFQADLFVTDDKETTT